MTDRQASWADWVGQCGSQVEAALERVLPPADSGQGAGLAPDRLHEAMRYAVLGGGKRVRPLLVYGAGEISGADSRLLDGAACAVELIHAYSLVHDDLPCMDDDALRRGKPTVHKQYDEATAMLVGDALQALAFSALVAPVVATAATAESPPPIAAMVATLARAAGSLGMAGGQALDLAAIGRHLERPQLETMHRLKTGAMLAVSVELGLLAGGPPQPAAAVALADYGAAIGLAFQVVDDILDVTADSMTLGKTAGKDQAQDKPTYVSMLGLEPSRELAQSLRQRAHAALQPFGDKAARLRQLADFVVDRLH
ncbi:MAG: polyprenyl synthetase family protein [Lautropia sp.]